MSQDIYAYRKNGLNVGGGFLFVLLCNCYALSVQFQYSFSHAENNVFKAEEILYGRAKKWNTLGQRHFNKILIADEQ